MLFSVQIGLILVSFVGLYECTELIIYFTDPGYFGADGQIVRVTLHHMNFTILNLTNIPHPEAIDYDEPGQNLYWTDLNLKQIRRSGPFGENDTVVAQLSNSSEPSGLAVDSGSRKLFYADRGVGEIGSINMDTLEKTVLVSSGLNKPKGLVAHTKQKKLYWVDYDSDQKLNSCDYDGSNVGFVADTGAVKPHGLALDERANRLYWADGTGHVKSISTDGTNIRTTFNRTGVIFNDISVFNDYIYVTMINYAFLLAMPVDGHHLASLRAESFKYPTGIHAFSPNFDQTQVCDNYKYGPNCADCGKCVANYMCEKTTGICVAGCQAGYKRQMCLEHCDDGYWGESCDNECGECRDGTWCDIYTGICPSGCNSGHKGVKCDESCGPNTYGNPCKDCGNCKGGVICDGLSGICPGGCQDGWRGERCDQRCGENTYGQCQPCGKCKENGPCDRYTGICVDGCASGYEGQLCDKVSEPKKETRGSSDLAIGLGVGLALLVVIAIVGILVFFCIKKKRDGAPPLSNFPVVKMERSPDKDPGHGNDYATIENMGTGDTISTTAIIKADELSQQTDIVYQNASTSSTA